MRSARPRRPSDPSSGRVRPTAPAAPGSSRGSTRPVRRRPRASCRRTRARRASAPPSPRSVTSSSLGIPSPNAPADLFGAAVALGQWIVVGAPQAAGNTGPDGVVWIFDRATGALVRKLDNPRSGRDDNFGAAVGLVGERLLVGAPLADD